MSIRLFIKLGMVSLLGSNLATPFIKNNFKQEDKDKKNGINESLLFIPDVDGSSLTEKKWTYGDGLQLFQNFIASIDKSAKVVLQNEKLLTKKLKKGANLFFVKIIVGNEERLAIGRLINVRLSQQEKINELIQEINKKIDGSKLSSDLKQQDIIRFANLLANKIDDKIKISLKNSKDQEKNLDAGNNTIKVKVLINNVILDHVIYLREVKKNNDSFFKEILNDLTKKNQTITKHDLTTNSMIIDALQVIEKQIQNSIPIARVTLLNQEDKFQQLKTSEFSVSIVVKIGTISQILKFNIKNIINQVANNPWNSFIALQQEKQFYNGITNKLFEVDNLSKVNAIIEIINDQLVSGEELTSANTFKDAFDCWVKDYWMQEVPAEHRGDEVKITLDESVDPQKKLQEEENYFVVRVTIGEESATTKVGVTGVVLLDNDRLDLFEQHLNDEFDGSSLNTQQTYEAALSLIRNKTNGFDGVIRLKLTNPKESKKKLTAPITKIMITFSSNNEKRNKEITISNINLSNKERLEIISKNLKENTIDAATLNTSQNQQDALKLITDYVTAIDSIAVVELENKDDKSLLVMDVNTIKVIVTVGEQKEIIDVKINKVTLSDKDRIKKVMAEVLKQDIDGSTLNTGQDINQALALVNEKVKAVDKDIKVKLVKVDDGANKLQENNNLFNVVIELNNAKEVMAINVAKVKLSATEKLAQLKKQLNKKELNASIFTTKNTVGEALEKLIKPEILRLAKDATITISENLDTKLTADTTELVVTIGLEDKTEAITFKLTGIKLSVEDRVDEVAAKITAEKFDQENLDTSKTNKELLDIIKNKIKMIDEKATIELKDPAISDDKIKAPNDEIEFIVKIGDVTKDITIKLKDIKKSDEDRLQALVDKLTEASLDLDGSTLNTKNTFNDALEMIKEKVIAQDPEANVSIIDNEYCKVKDNKIKCQIKIGDKIREMIFNLKDVRLSDEERTVEIEKWLLEKEFDGNGLTTNNLIKDGLARILEQIKQTYPDAEISLQDSENPEEKLQEPFNVIAVKVIIDGLQVDTALKINNIVLSDNDLLEKIRNNFEENQVDGSSLTSDNIINDALELIKKEIVNNGGGDVTVKITDNKSGKNKLTANDNVINVTIKSGKKIQKINVTVNNVKLSDGDKIKNFIDSLDKKIDGKDLTTNNTTADVLKMVKEKFEDSGLEFVLGDDEDEAQKLQENNKIKIIAKLGDKEQEIDFEVPNVKITDADLVKKIGNEFNNKEIDGSDLTTDNVVGDILDNLKDKFKKIDNRAEIELVDLDKNDKLKVKDNELKFKVKIGDKVEEITVNVKDIKKSKNDKMQDITKSLKEMIIDGKDLTTDNVVGDTLSLILEKIREIDPSGSVQIDNQDLKQEKLKPQDNTFKVKIMLEDLSEEIDVKVTNIKLSAGDIIDRALKKIKDKKLDGSDLTTDNTYQDIINIIQEQLDETNSDVIVELFDEAEKDKNLVKNDNEIKLRIKHGDDIKSVEIKVTNVINSDKTIIDNVKKDLENHKDALLRDLTTNETVGDLINKMQKLAEEVDKDAKIVTDMDLTANLNESENPITFKIVSGTNEKINSIDFKGVKESDKNIISKIQEKLLIIEGDNLTGKDTKEKTLTLVKALLKDLMEKYQFEINLFYPNVDNKTKLKVSKDNVDYAINLNGKKYRIKGQIINIKEDPNIARLENLTNEIKNMEVDLGLLCLKPKESLVEQIMQQLKQKKFTDFNEVTIEVIDTPNVGKKTTNLLGSKKYNKVRVKVKVGDYEKILVVKYAVVIDPNLCLKI